ncbi:MAG: TRAP transporter large permease subunit, partial [Burkholderiaceae bacterium]|nr:TRAP transporter large permease subunit [Burkholderiaceae bacterium]
MSQSAIDSATQEKLDALIRQEEGDSNSYKGLFAIFLTLAAVAMSLFHLYAAYAIVPTQVLRTVHVSFVLFLVFLSFPLTAKFKNRTIFGAFLQFTGAGKFFIDFSFAAMGGKSSGVGRTIVLSSFLLGGPSGSGVATTVTVGSVAAPMLDKVGYEKNAAGGLLAAGGLGAIISPPVLGAAAFLIADFLRISYLDVLLMSCIPTILFYLGLFTMVEIDVRKYGMKAIHFETVESAWSLSKKYWFHFFSLISIVVFMMMGFSPIMSVFWATVVSALTSMLRRDTAILSYDWLTGKQPFLKGLYESNLTKALSSGSTGVLAIAATCAGAGLIVGTVTLTGLGLKFSSIVIAYAGGSLLLTAIFTALIVWIVGLAVPVT